MQARQTRLAEYRSTAWPNVAGWVDPPAIPALEAVANYQAAMGIHGDALEIGVFHGRFFLALPAAIEDGECAVAVDIFGDQFLNVDQSAGSNELAAVRGVKSASFNFLSAV